MAAPAHYHRRPTRRRMAASESPSSPVPQRPPSQPPRVGSPRGARLHHHRCRHGRVRARQPAVGRPRRERPAARGGRQGRLLLDRHPGRLPLHHRQPPHRLVLQDRAGSGAQRPHHRLRPRPGPRRLLLHQRDDLHAGAEERLRPLGIARQPRLGLGRRAAGVQALGGLPARRRRVARGRRRDAGRGAAGELGDPRRLAASRRGVRDSENRRVQPGRQLRQRLLPDEPAQRPALERHEGVPAPGDAPAEPDRADRGAGAAPRGRSGRRRPAGDRGRAGHGRAAVGAARGDPGRRGHRLAADPAVVGHRSRRAAAASTASRSFTTWPGWARTCTTTCRSAASTR